MIICKNYNDIEIMYKKTTVFVDFYAEVLVTRDEGTGNYFIYYYNILELKLVSINDLPVDIYKTEFLLKLTEEIRNLVGDDLCVDYEI